MSTQEQGERMTATSTAVVPFGKYKGQPVEVLMADTGYRDWLAQQPWFRDRYANIFQTIINYNAEPAASPEHNEMQARFLADKWCLALGCALYRGIAGDLTASAERANNATYDRLRTEFTKAYPYLNEDGLNQDWATTGILNKRFEQSGWDVVFQVRPAQLTVTMNPDADAVMLPCICGPCDHTACPEDAQCQGGEQRYLCKHSYCRDAEQRRLHPAPLAGRSVESGHHEKDNCSWVVAAAEDRKRSGHGWTVNNAGTLSEFLLRGFHADAHSEFALRIECKPDLGDDYPAVLRQVCGYDRSYAQPVVVARRTEFEAVTWEQVKQIFAASDVRLIRESDITALARDA